MGAHNALFFFINTLVSCNTQWAWGFNVPAPGPFVEVSKSLIACSGRCFESLVFFELQAMSGLIKEMTPTVRGSDYGVCSELT